MLKEATSQKIGSGFFFLSLFFSFLLSYFFMPLNLFFSIFLLSLYFLYLFLRSKDHFFVLSFFVFFTEPDALALSPPIIFPISHIWLNNAAAFFSLFYLLSFFPSPFIVYPRYSNFCTTSMSFLFHSNFFSLSLLHPFFNIHVSVFSSTLFLSIAFRNLLIIRFRPDAFVAHSATLSAYEIDHILFFFYHHISFLYFT